VSQSSPGQPTPSPDAHQASSQALLDELRSAADRARDERLKLARLVKHSAELPVNSASQNRSEQAPAAAPQAGPVSDARLSALAEQVERLEQAVSDKRVALEQSQRDINSRTQYLESLRHTITDTTQAFMTQVEEAQHFKAHVDAAKQHVRMSAGRVVEEVRQQLIDLDTPINERINQLNDLDKQIDQRIARMQQMHKQANEAVNQHLSSALRTAKEQAAELSDPIKQEIDAYLIAQRAKMESAIHEKIKALDVDVEDALAPVTQRFDELVAESDGKVEKLVAESEQKVHELVKSAQGRVDMVAKGLDPITEQIERVVADAQAKADLFAETLPDRIETEISTQFDALRGRIAEQAKSIVDGLDEQAMEQAGQVIHERVAQSLDTYLSKAEAEAGGYVDGLIAKLDSARDEAVDAYKQSIQDIEADTQLDRDQAIAKLDEEAKRIKAKVDERIEHAQSVLEQATDGIVTRAASVVDSALQNADKKLEDYESAAVDHLRAIDDGIEHEIEASRKRLVEFEKQTKKQGEDAVRIVEDGIAEAQKRLSGFESGITQRISLAVKSTDEATGSIDERLDKVEKDAARRIMQMVELAETSGNAVAESIDELSQSAQATAERAQQDLDEKLRAFEHISAEALRTAEDTLRENIGELRDSSRAMIEMVGRQVKAQAGEIEPQTREVISQAEQTMRRRIGELRDAAQSMVDITVTRLESQLEEVKAKAQQQAFEGVEPQQPGQAPEQGNEAA